MDDYDYVSTIEHVDTHGILLEIETRVLNYLKMMLKSNVSVHRAWDIATRHAKIFLGDMLKNGEIYACNVSFNKSLTHPAINIRIMLTNYEWSELNVKWLLE